MNLSFYKFRFMKRRVLGLIRNLHRYSYIIIIHKERCDVLYTRYKHVGCKVILKMFLRQMEGYSQNVSLLSVDIAVTQVYKNRIYSFLWRVYTAKTSRGVASHGVGVGYAVRGGWRSRPHWHPPTARRLWEPAEHRLPHTPCEIATGLSHTQDF